MVTIEMVEALGVQCGSAETDEITDAQFNIFKTWAEAIVTRDKPSGMDANLQDYATALLIRHMAKIKENLDVERFDIADYSEARLRQMGMSSYLKTYLDLMARAEIPFIAIEDIEE